MAIRKKICTSPSSIVAPRSLLGYYNHFYVFSFIRIYFFIFFNLLNIFPVTRYCVTPLLVTALLCLVTPQNCANYWHHDLYVRVQPCDSDLKERFLSLIVLFVYLLIFFAIRISRFFPLTFFVIRIFSIRIRHPQVSGPRFTDTLLKIFEVEFEI